MRFLSWISPFLVLLAACGNFSGTVKTGKPAPQLVEAPDKIEFYWVGHATVLMRIYDKWIITDPNFSPRTGTVVKRLSEPGIEVASLKPVDAIVISHNHFDHLDAPSLKLLAGSRHLFAPKSGFAYIPDAVASNLHRVETGYASEEAGVRITSVPVAHFGGRLLVDNLWDGEPYTGYIIEYKGVTVFFAGDTGYDAKYFRDLKQKYKIDVALIPVGPAGGFTSGGIGNAVHVNPYGALQIYRDCGARYMIPIHHSTFYRRGGREMEMIKDAIAISGRSDYMLLLEAGDGVEFKQTKTGLALQNLNKAPILEGQTPAQTLP
ncbi:MAG: MBL fold metallo-hydrolase [Turneriella sp.]|nr:MBL fold metallo-hydrolase [Turneriella sp.]